MVYLLKSLKKIKCCFFSGESVLSGIPIKQLIIYTVFLV